MNRLIFENNLTFRNPTHTTFIILKVDKQAVAFFEIMG